MNNIVYIALYFIAGLVLFTGLAILWRVALVKLVGKYWGNYTKGGFVIGYNPDKKKK